MSEDIKPEVDAKREAAQPWIIHPPAPRPPSISSLILERQRATEQSLDELVAVERGTRLLVSITMEEVKLTSASTSQSLRYIMITLPIIAFLLGAILVAIVLK